MLIQKICSKISITSFLLVNILIIFSYSYVYAFTFTSWEHGVSGYETAYTAAKKNEKPLIVYFHIEGSIWNERMNDEYLASAPVFDFLMDIPKVEINGEGDASEEKLVSQYKVKQFPAFYVLIPSFNDNYKRIHPFSETDMTAEEFLEKLKGMIAYQYSAKAFSCFENKEYDNALKYYERSSKYHPEDAETYYSIGTIYNFKYHNDKESDEFLENARKYYQKALEINPDHENSKIELEKLDK